MTCSWSLAARATYHIHKVLTARLYACHIHLKQFVKSTKGDFREIELDVTTSLQLQGLRGNYGVYLALIYRVAQK